MARRLRLRVADDALDLGRGALVEAMRALAREQLVHHGAERVDVGCGGDGLAAHLLRRRILGCHHLVIADREPRVGDVLFAEELGDAEVEQLHVAALGHEDVARLEIAVHEQISVRVGDGAEHLLHEGESRGDVERALVAIEIERAAVDVLHREPGKVGGSDAAVEQARDVRVRERRENAALLEEAADEQRIVLAAATHELERGRLRELPVCALGEEDLAHAAVPELAHDAPRAEERTGGNRGGHRPVELQHERACDVGDRPLEEPVRIFAGGDHPFDLRAQCDVGAARAIEIDGAIARWKIERIFENRLDALPRAVIARRHFRSSASAVASQPLALIQSRRTVRDVISRADAVSSSVSPRK